MTPSETAPAREWFEEGGVVRTYFRAYLIDMGWTDPDTHARHLCEFVLSGFVDALSLRAAPPVPAAADYEARVTAMADALHEDCRLEWQAIRVVDPGRAITQHGVDAHYGEAHALVRRLWPELDTASGPAAGTAVETAGTLDAAWAEVERALPPRWGVSVQSSTDGCYAETWPPMGGGVSHLGLDGFGSTPVAALNALAAALARRSAPSDPRP